MRNYGQTSRYSHDSAGINSRLDEMQAAILRVKLLHLDKDNNRRKSIAQRYKNELVGVETLLERTYGEGVYHLFVVKTDKREEFMKYMEENEIKTLIHFPMPIHAQKAFVWERDDEYTNATQFASMIVSIPIYPELEDDQIDTIISTINAFDN